MYMYSWNYQTEEGSQRVTRKQVLRDMQIVFLQTLFSNRGGGARFWLIVVFIQMKKMAFKGKTMHDTRAGEWGVTSFFGCSDSGFLRQLWIRTKGQKHA